MGQFGKYHLVRRLGAGGMAEVFLARSSVAQGLEKQLVLKKIHPAFAKSKHFMTMFVDEAKIALGLNHPNIVQVFDFGQVGDTFFLCMEYVEGPDLLRLLQECARTGRRVPYELCAYVVQQVAKGLDYAHRKVDEYGEPLDIVHRDVSPQNVLISWDGAVKLTDFGIARARVIQEEEGVVKGKFAYMSPEQARGEPVDHRSDVFSAGIVLFELASGRPLHSGKGKEVLDAVRACRIPAPRERDPHIPQALEEILRSALSPNRDDRFATARDLQNALGRFQFEHARTSGDLADSSGLAQFVTSIVPRTTPAPTPFALPGPHKTPSPALGPRGAHVPDPAPAPVPSPPTPIPQPAITTSVGRRAEGEKRERKRLLVLEGVLTGLVALRRQVGAERAKKAVADFLHVAEDIAYKHEALVHRADDASFTIVVGLPVAAEDDAFRAIRLALALVDALDGIGRDVEPELRLSVGIERQSAIVKRKGANCSCELADRELSISLRLAREARGGEVLVGGAVYGVARMEWNFEELPALVLPEATHAGTIPPRVYRLRGPKEREQRMRERMRAVELVGRELELKALRDAYRDVLANRCRVFVTVVGEAGLGKRSLVSAFLKTVPPGEARLLRAAARAATRDTPFAIVADLIRDMLGLAESAEPKEAHKRLVSAVAALEPKAKGSAEGTTADQDTDLLHTLGTLLGLRAPDPEADAEERRRQLVQALRQVEAHLTAETPLILVIEDVHWADSGSFEVFLELLGSGLPGHATQLPVLGIATTRPDPRISKATTDAGAAVICLGELDEDDRQRLILNRFAPGEDARELAKEISAKAGGNPFFIREMLDSLTEQGILASHQGFPGKLRWVRRVPVPVPASAHALVATRLDQLPSKEKETLERAAILGRSFSVPDLTALLERPCDDDLARLAGRGLLDATTGGGGFAFRNELTLEVAYDQIPLDERPRLHLSVAELSVGAKSYRKGADDAQVARHLELAGDLPRAARTYMSAAQHAIDVRSTAEAFRHLTSALTLLPRQAHGERYLCHAEREAILGAQARIPQQRREIDLMRREAEAAGDLGAQAEAKARLAELYRSMGKYAAARIALDPAHEAARQTGDSLAVAEALRIEAALLRDIGQNVGSLELCTQALRAADDERADAVRDPRTARRRLLERGRILNIRGTALMFMSELREAINVFAEALVIYRKLRVPRMETSVLNNMGIAFSSLGEQEEAIAHYKRSVKIDLELGDRAHVGRKLGNIAQAYFEAGDLDKAEHHLTKALPLAESVRDKSGVANAIISLGQVYLKRDDPTGARAHLERGLDLAEEVSNRYQAIRARTYLAMARLASGDPPEIAVELSRGAAELARQAPMPIGEVYGLAVEGIALSALGREHDAAERSAQAVALLDGIRDPEGAEEILFIHARLARLAGRPDEARRSLERAHNEVLSRAKRLRSPELRQRYLDSRPARDILAQWRDSEEQRSAT